MSYSKKKREEDKAKAITSLNLHKAKVESTWKKADSAVKRERSKLLQIKEKSKKLVTDSKQMVEDEKQKQRRLYQLKRIREK